MRELKKTNLKDFKESWTICAQCAGCYYRGPIIPHNWRELPPPEWASPLHKCPSYEYFNFRAYTAVGRGNLAALVFDDEKYPITDDLIKIIYTCNSCGMCSEICRIYPFISIISHRIGTIVVMRYLGEIAASFRQESLLQKGIPLWIPFQSEYYKIEVNYRRRVSFRLMTLSILCNL